MTVPSPRTWSSGFVDDADLNQEIRDPLNFLLAAPRVSVFKSANGSLSDGVWGVIGFDQELYDPYSTPAHNNVTNNSRLVAAEPGLYAVHAKLRFGAITTGTVSVEVRRNAAGSQAGGTRLEGTTDGATTGGDESPALNFETELNAADYIEMFGLQTSGGTKAVVSGAGNTVFQMRWVAAL